MVIFNISSGWVRNASSVSNFVCHQLHFLHMPGIVAVEIYENPSHKKAFFISVKAPGIEKRGVPLEVHREDMSEETTLSIARDRAKALCRFFYGNNCFEPVFP